MEATFRGFPTPVDVADRMVELASIQTDSLVLEPSAGRGAIIDRVLHFHPKVQFVLVELNPSNAAFLRDAGREVIEGDFLTTGLPSFDRVVMNPPFTAQQDTAHILRAFSLLKSGGTLVSVVSESPFFLATQRAEQFHSVVDEYGESIKLPTGAFKESGTGVSTRLVKLMKPANRTPALAGRG